MKVPILRILCAPVKICQIPNVISQTACQIFFKFYITLQCHEIQFLCTFLAQTLVKSSPLKCNFLRLSSSRVKIHQIPYVNFEATSQFPFRFFIILQYHYLQIFCKLQLMHFLFGQKDPMKIPILTLSSVLFKICQIPHVIFQTTSQLFFKFSMTLHCHEIQLLCTFLAQTSVKSSPLKCIFLRLSSSRVKIHQIPYVNFEATSQFLFRFFIILQCHYL